MVSQYKLIPSLPLTNDVTTWKDAIIEVFSKLIINPSLACFLLSDTSLQESILDYFDMKFTSNYNITLYLYQMLMLPSPSNTLFSSNLLHNTLKLLAESEKDGIYIYSYIIYYLDIPILIKMYNMENYPEFYSSIQIVYLYFSIYL